MLPDFREYALLRLLHALDHLLTARSSREFIGLGQQRAFPRNLANGPRENLVLGQPRDDLLGGQAFRNRHEMLHHLAFDNGADDVAQTGVLLERIFARLEAGARFQCEHASVKRPAIVVDHAFTLKNLRDVAHTSPRRNVDDPVFLQRSGRLDLLLAVDIDSANAKHPDQHERDDRVAGYHQRTARTRGALRRRRHLFRFECGTRTARRNGRSLSHRCNLNPIGSIAAGDSLPQPQQTPATRIYH